MAEEFFDPNIGPSPYGVMWNAPGTRTYFLGVDRGMLYVEGVTPVPWPGLVSVEEKPTNGEIVPFYIDGIRRRNDHTLSEYAATISSYTAPREFAPCEGERELAPGLFLGQQPRSEFHFSYRSFIGDDIVGVQAHYQLHLVYNALTEPAGRVYETISADSDPQVRSWEIATLPEDFENNDHPSAHLKIDSRYTTPEKLEEIQLILYGTPEILPRFPTLEEVYLILSAVPIEEPEEEVPWVPDEEQGGDLPTYVELRRSFVSDARFEGLGIPWVEDKITGVEIIDGRFTAVVAEEGERPGISQLFDFSNIAPVPTGIPITFSFEKVHEDDVPHIGQLQFKTAAGVNTGPVFSTLEVSAFDERIFVTANDIPSDATMVDVYMGALPSATPYTPIGVMKPLMEIGTLQPYFDEDDVYEENQGILYTELHQRVLVQWD